MVRIELDRLSSYDDAALIAELHRVAALIPGRRLRRADFEEHSKVSASTLGRRFGTWERALDAAGLGERLDASTLGRSRDHVLAEIRRVARELDSKVLRRNEFFARSAVGARPIKRLFRSWSNVPNAADLDQSSIGKRYTDEECFENLLAVWTRLGRPPRHREMALPPSTIGPKAYVHRWRTWRRALSAFVEQVSAESPPVTAT
jgi:hypothetical protein